MRIGISVQDWPVKLDRGSPAVPPTALKWVRSWRIIAYKGHENFGLCWGGIQPESWLWQWALLDRYVAAAPPGRSIVYVLGYAPWWAVGNRAPIVDHADGSSSEANVGFPLLRGPVSQSALVTFASRLAARYRGRMDFQVWNEPGRYALDPAFGGDGGAELARLHRAIRPAILAADPGARITSPPVSNISGRGGADLRMLLTAPDGAGGRLVDHCDVVAVHTYPAYPAEVRTPSGPNNSGPDHLDAWMPPLQAMLAGISASALPLWATESGYVVFDDVVVNGQPISYRNPPTPETEARRARHVRECIAAHRRWGFERLIYFGWDGGNGLVQSPAAVAAWNESV